MFGFTCKMSCSRNENMFFHVILQNTKWYEKKNTIFLITNCFTIKIRDMNRYVVFILPSKLIKAYYYSHEGKEIIIITAVWFVSSLFRVTSLNNQQKYAYFWKISFRNMVKHIGRFILRFKSGFSAAAIMFFGVQVGVILNRSYL